MSDVYDTIVTTEKGKVLYIGDRAFDTAVKRNLALPIGFSSSRIRSSDKFFLYIRSLEMISEHTANMLGAICGDSVPDTGSVIIVCGGKLSGKRENLIVKVINKEMSEADKEVLLVIDGTTGQNAISQVKAFKEEADITGLVLTKLDGTAKGGVVIGIVEENKIPVKFIGVGEKIDDMEIFNSDDFVKAII